MANGFTKIKNNLLAQYEAGAIEAGIDEAGRGCYAGPVFAAAVILAPDFHHPLLYDSKQMSPAERLLLKQIIETEAKAWAVGIATVDEIDKYNILKANYMAMHRAIDKLGARPQRLLIDGNRFAPYAGISHTCIVKGDSLFTCIAAASVLAKTHRDAYMEKLHEQFAEYDWKQNKGYGTAQHRQAIEQYGLTTHHRKSFNILPARQPGLFDVGSAGS